MFKTKKGGTQQSITYVHMYVSMSMATCTHAYLYKYIPLYAIFIVKN